MLYDKNKSFCNKTNSFGVSFSGKQFSDGIRIILKKLLCIKNKYGIRTLTLPLS
jgi:hypothetical protein